MSLEPGVVVGWLFSWLCLAGKYFHWGFSQQQQHQHGRRRVGRRCWGERNARGRDKTSGCGYIASIHYLACDVIHGLAALRSSPFPFRWILSWWVVEFRVEREESGYCLPFHAPNSRKFIIDMWLLYWCWNFCEETTTRKVGFDDGILSMRA